MRERREWSFWKWKGMRSTPSEKDDKRRTDAESGKGKEGNDRRKMERMGNWLFIALLMLWKIEKVEAMSEEGQRKRSTRR